MKTLGSHFAVAAALALSATGLGAAPVSVPSTLTAATVYVDRAVVTRTGTAQLVAGETELVFERLPANLFDASLQVSARGTASASILDVNARVTYVEATTNPRIKAIEDELTGVQHQDAELKNKLALLDQQRALLGRIETAVTAPPPRDATGVGERPSFEEWQKLLTFQSDNLARLSSEQQSAVKQREDLAAKSAALEAQLKALRGRQQGSRSFKAVTVRVSASNAGRLDLSLSYGVPGASWAPAYDARLRTEQRSVDLTYFGVVRNATGEDWNALALTLSTARPSQGGGAPTLPPWIVDIYRPMPRPMAAPATSSGGMGALSKAAPRGRGTDANESAMADQLEIKEATIAQASVETGATSATFKIANPVTLPSDNTTQRVAITVSKLAATLRYESTPKLLEVAFLSASLVNTSEFPLLAGAVNTFLDDTFVATSRLKTIMPTERFDLALGADDGISVKRRLLNRFAEDTGLMGKGRRVTYEFLVTLVNNKKTTERVVFKEAVPISRDEKIVVKLLTPAEREIGTTEGQKEITRETEGLLSWRIDLKAGEKREIALKLSVDYPSEINVSGLD